MGRKRFRHTHGRGLDAHGLTTKGITRSTESTNDFIVDKKDAVAFKDRLYLLVVPVGGHDHATRSQYRFGDKSRDGFRSFFLNQVRQAVGKSSRELVLRLSFASFPIIVRRFRVQNALNRQIKRFVKRRQARETSARHRHAVIAAPTRDNFLLLGSTDEIVVVPHHLNLRVVRVRAG